MEYEVLREGKVIGCMKKPHPYAVARARTGRNRRVKVFWRVEVFGELGGTNYRTLKDVRAAGFELRRKR